MQDDLYPEQFRSLDLFHEDGYTVTSTKLKTEFRNLQKIIMKGHANLKLGGQRDKYDDGEDHVFAASFTKIVWVISPSTTCNVHVRSINCRTLPFSLYQLTRSMMARQTVTSTCRLKHKVTTREQKRYK